MSHFSAVPLPSHRVLPAAVLLVAFFLEMGAVQAQAGDAPPVAATPAVPAAPTVPAAPRAPQAPEVPNVPAIPDSPNAPDQKRLEAARQRLEQAAQEVAQLSMQLANSAPLHMFIDMDGAGTRRALLGVQIDPAAGKGGARVSAVSPGGPAALAGLQPGDLIVSLGNTNLAQADNGGRALVENMRSAVPDKPLKLRVLRAGKFIDLTVTPRATSFVHRGLPRVPGPPRVDAEALGAQGTEPMMLRLNETVGGVAGMELATLSPRLGQYFGADKGVLVLRAPAGSDWKLEDGDVITSIDGRIPNSGAHATHILSSYQAGERINLKLMRQRKALSLEIVTPVARDTLLERTMRLARP